MHCGIIFIFQFSPNVLSYVISFITNDDEQWKGYFYIACLIALNIAKSLTNSQYFYHLGMLGLRAKTALNCTVYTKALKLSPSAKRDRTGEVKNCGAFYLVKQEKSFPIEQRTFSPHSILLEFRKIV